MRALGNGLKMAETTAHLGPFLGQPAVRNTLRGPPLTPLGAYREKPALIIDPAPTTAL
jgi:hypothetical protein